MPEQEQPSLETQLPDLRGNSVAELAQPLAALAGYRTELLAQVERPRPNIGSGPPGRAD